MQLRIVDDLDTLSHAAAQLVVQRVQQAVRVRGKASLVLSGGDTPMETYQLLARTPYRDQMPWPQLDIFFGDERCVPPQDARSNQRMARVALLDHVPIEWEQVHAISCVGDPSEAAQEYESLLRDYFAGREPQFDVVLLGMGENGHTASLFPHTSVLQEEERCVAEVYVQEQGMFRVTLTAPLLNRAALVIFLVSGASKAQTLREVLEGPTDPERLPAQLIHPEHGELFWLVDRQAAGMLSHA